tara:strand:- start:779 stop:1024 length:246 start_codon:yes stop_codon:yes gene_type:complete
MKTIDSKWTKYASDKLVGKTIKLVRYLSEKEAESLGWYSRPLVIEFTDNSIIFPSKDDEGNDGGALFGQSKDNKEWTFPVL